ncbi:hypothetical protein MycrhN_3463 [Mycolicibacterium rhodesiae NBB3]|uniref:Uncharacterized protein n=1 Tax=Mycolicibacterium rhodesiae (strain NBB3) TaxID=710685 RepID=G8RS26_MYCRN|nr:hypothetical protein [Mycolicibacterium rhodesiae]AEV73983.1 hypothetical protein MycrhN_3463 [Mycolicibacterium rhodesiae NBB3]
MNEDRITVYRRSALALSTVVITSALWMGVAAPALADPYDDGGSSESGDSGSSDQPADEPGGEAPGADEPGPGADEPGPEAPAEPPADEAPGGGGADEAPGGGADEPGAPEAPGGPADEGGPGDPDSNVTDPGVDADSPEPNVAEASQEAFDEAHSAEAVDVESTEASESEVTEVTETLESFESSTTTTSSSTWSSGVSQWNSSWTGYDNWYRPVFTNPYSTPLQMYYWYDDATRLFEVPPMGRAVLTAPDAGVYNFTAVNKDPSGKPVTVSTGSFTGGGYKPAPGQPPPAKPAPISTFKNVLVQLKYNDKLSKPFRVNTVADLGDDPSVGGHRVLLDNETPVWGTWTKTAGGERLFEVTSTNQLPGLTQPSQGPVAGYQVQLTSSEQTTAAPAKKAWVKPVIIVGAIAAVLVIGGIAFFLAGRRKKTTP